MRIAVLMILLMHGLWVNSQSWFPPEAEWYFLSLPAGTAGAGHVHVSVGEDTIIAGQPCRELQFVQALGSVAPPWGYTFIDQPSWYVAEVDGLISLLNEESLTFDTLYNMAAVPNDTWNFPSLPDWMDCTGPLGYFSVTDTGTLVQNDVVLRWLAVDILNPIPWDTTLFYTYQDTIVERIGTLRTFFDPYDECLSQYDANFGGPFRCYSDDEFDYTHITSWWPYGGTVCAYLPNGIAELEEAQIHVSPNPATDRITINGSPPGAVFLLELLDLTGRVVQTDRVAGGTGVDVSALPSGMFIYRLTERNGSLAATGSWVKM